MRDHRKIIVALLPLLFSLTSGCSSVGYYSQAVGGHLKLMRARQPIAELLDAESTSPDLVEKLQTLVDARQFAVTELSLPDNDSYNTYVETGRRYVTWNVVAAEEFSLRAKTWCFPVAGCVNYKGYFAEEDARNYATELREENYDVNVGGALAYSTLGWFEDPVLDTMLNGGDIRYVGTLFHELAHQLLYIQDDSNFNEAFASFVEQQGLRIWLRSREEDKRIALYNDYLGRGDDFSVLLKTTRQELLAVYNKDLPDEEKRAGKQAAFENMQKNYAELKEKWNGYNGFDGWFAREMNNARLVSVATYRKLVPAFAALFVEADRELPVFYELAKELADLPTKERQQRMNAYLEQNIDFADL